jgi:23S rRNA (adenine-N6)-dimethyltransferase
VAGRRASRARPSSARSQHFLRTPALAAELVSDAGVARDDLVVEIGAGTGRITSVLSHVARRVIAVELDSRLADGLRDRWANVEVLEEDAARLPLPHEPFRVVSNLPFSRTTELLHLLLDDPATPLVRADLVVEWAVAHKHGVPWPSSLNGVLWGATYEASVTRRLPRHAFTPPPSVDAGVLVFRRRDRPLVPQGSAAAYHRFVADGFRHGIRSVVSARDRDSIGTRAATARDLDAHQWSRLFLRRSPTRHSPPRRRGRYPIA